MFRKATLGLVAAAALGAAALAASGASAGGLHRGLWGFGRGHGYGLGFSGFFLNSRVNDCYQQLWIPTSAGTTLRTVNVCGYTAY